MNVENSRNRDAENAVIGSVLLYPELFDEAATLLRPEDFYYESSKTLFSLFASLSAEGKPLELVTIVDELRKKSLLEEVGGEAALAELISSVASGTHLKSHCRIVADCAIRRRLLDASEKISAAALDGGTDPKRALATAEEQIFAVAEKKSLTTVSLGAAITEFYHYLDETAEGSEVVKTGFEDVDDILGGLRASELIIVAARPGMGKTAFASNVALYAASKNKKVLFVSLEMSRTELATRMVCSRAFVSVERLHGRPTEETMKRFMEGAREVDSFPILIDDTSSRTVAEIASLCRREKRKNGLDLAIIDYIGLIEPDDPKQPRQEQVARIARRLKLLAKEVNIPVLCCAQLNRNLEQTKDNRPKLSHLRESGAIEQDADAVILLHREEYYLSKEEAVEKDLDGKAEIIIAKHRNGRTGSAFLRWAGGTCQFLNDEHYSPFEEFSSFESDAEFD